MKLQVTLLMLIIAMIGLTGCGGSQYSLKVNQDMVQVKDVTKAYITFSRVGSLGKAISSTVFEFDPDKQTTNLVGVISAGTRVIYEVTPGVHHFYLHGGEKRSITTVEVSAGNMYYMQIEVGMGAFAARFYFNPITKKEQLLATQLIHQKCTDELFRKYNFQVDQEDTSGLLKATSLYSSSLNIGIECENDKVTAISDFVTIKSLLEASLVTPNKQAYIFHKNGVTPAYLNTVITSFNEMSKEERFENGFKPEDGVAFFIHKKKKL